MSVISMIILCFITIAVVNGSRFFYVTDGNDFGTVPASLYRQWAPSDPLPESIALAKREKPTILCGVKFVMAVRNVCQGCTKDVNKEEISKRSNFPPRRFVKRSLVGKCCTEGCMETDLKELCC